MKYVKIAAGVIATLALLIGTVWILQGTNILPGSFMTGNMQWAYRGAGLAVVAVLILFWVLRTPGVWKGIAGTFGVLLILGGGIWILQGLNILPGSFMTGHIEWAYRGGIMAVIGAGLLWVSRR